MPTEVRLLRLNGDVTNISLGGGGATYAAAAAASASNAINASYLAQTARAEAVAAAADAASAETATEAAAVVAQAAKTAAEAAEASALAASASASGSAAAAAALVGGAYVSRAAFAAAVVPSSVEAWSIIHNGRKLDYVRDANGTACTSANGVKGSPAGDCWAEHWGAISQATKAEAEAASNDNAPLIQAALDWMAANSKVGPLRLGSGYYRVGATVNLLARSLGFVGQGLFSTFLIGTATTGAVVRCYRDNPIMRDLTIDATTTRKGSAYTSMVCGLWAECEDIPDTPDLRIKNACFSNFGITNQPGQGAVLVGPAFMGSWDGPWIRSNRGDGITCDYGFTSGRVNANSIFTPGLITITGGEISYNGGHGWRGGDGPDGTTGNIVRIQFDNVEVGDNCSDIAICKAPVQVYHNGSNFGMTNSILKATVANELSGFKVLGRSFEFLNMRWGGLKHLGFVSGLDIVQTTSVCIRGGSVFNPVDGSSMLVGVVVMLEPGQTVEPVEIEVSGFSGSIVRPVAPDNDTIGGTGPERLVGAVSNYQRRDFIKSSDQSVTNSTTLVSVDGMRIWMSANQFVNFRFVVCASATTSLGDLILRVAGPAGCTTEYSTPVPIKVDTAEAIVTQAVTTESSQIRLGQSLAKRIFTLEGVAENGSSAGWLELQFAQATADASTLTIHGRSSRAEFLVSKT